MGKKDEPWKVQTYDTFEGRFYGGGVEYPTEDAAKQEARNELERIEKLQPSDSSGGQGFGGIQDRVFIVRPDGSKYRFRG